MEYLIILIVAGIGYWIYKCQQKEDCSITGECKTVFRHLSLGRALTADQARKYYGIKHLRSVISRLRNVYNKDIETVVKKGKAVYKQK